MVNDQYNGGLDLFHLDMKAVLILRCLRPQLLAVHDFERIFYASLCLLV